MKCSNFYTYSIEEALSPFILQVESLINLRHINSFRPLSQYSLCKACENVNVAVISFITTAENIAVNYPQVTTEIRNSCNWSRSLVTKILDNTLYGSSGGAQIKEPGFHSLTKSRRDNNDLDNEENSPRYNSLDKASTCSTGIVASAAKIQNSNATFSQFAEGLMRSVERILLLADWIVVLDLRRAIVKVIQSLGDLDSRGSENFPVFMHMFSRFGADMVELGEMSGQRQADLKNSQLRCLVALVRSMLERTTMMILAVWKINFRHDGRATRGLRALTFQHTSYLLDLLMALLVVSHPLYPEMSRNFLQEQSTINSTDFLEREGQNIYEKLFGKRQHSNTSNHLADSPYIWQILLKLKTLVNTEKPHKQSTNSSDDEPEEPATLHKNDEAVSLVTDLLSAGQQFTQASFIALSERQHIISLCRRLRVQLRSCLDNSNNANNAISDNKSDCNDDIDRNGDDNRAANQNAVQQANRNNSQARLFVEDLCDQILTVTYNLTIKYGEEIITNCLKFSQEKDLLNSTNFERTGSFKKSSKQGNTGTDDRKPPRPGEFITNNGNLENDNNNNTQYQTDFLHLEDNPALVNNKNNTNNNNNHNNVELSTKNIENLKLKLMAVCNFLTQISMSKEISLVCLLTRSFIETLSQKISLSIQIFQEINGNKHAKDCAEVLLDVWTSVVTDISNIMNDIAEWRDHQYSYQYRPALMTANRDDKSTGAGGDAISSLLQTQLSAISSSDIMRQYQQRHNPLATHYQHQFIHRSTTPVTLSAPGSPAVPIINNSIRNNQMRTAPNSIRGLSRQSPSRQQATIHNSNSINSLDRERYNFNSTFTNPCDAIESPNPWLSVSEIERIIFMKGRVVIDLASQITMFSHNEGPLKTSVELMAAVQQLVRELTNFHGFAERNIISEQMLADLDRFPSLISSIYNILSLAVSSRQEMFTKIDRIVEMARYSSTLITAIMSSWRSQSVMMTATKPARSQSSGRMHQISTPPTSAGPLSRPFLLANSSGTSNTRFPFDESGSLLQQPTDTKSCFSDSAAGPIFGSAYGSSVGGGVGVNTSRSSRNYGPNSAAPTLIRSSSLNRHES